jgi:hypothetical protein
MKAVNSIQSVVANVEKVFKTNAETGTRRAGIIDLKSDFRILRIYA